VTGQAISSRPAGASPPFSFVYDDRFRQAGGRSVRRGCYARSLEIWQFSSLDLMSQTARVILFLLKTRATPQGLAFGFGSGL
jgi:hypothetical protein